MSGFSRSDGQAPNQLLARFAGTRFGVCGIVPAIRLGDALRLIASHAQPQARFLLLLVLVSSLQDDPSDRAVHGVIDLVWGMTAEDDWADVRPHHDLDGEVIGFSQGIVETEDWDGEILAAVMIANVSARAHTRDGLALVAWSNLLRVDHGRLSRLGDRARRVAPEVPVPRSGREGS